MRNHLLRCQTLAAVRGVGRSTILKPAYLDLDQVSKYPPVLQPASATRPRLSWWAATVALFAVARYYDHEILLGRCTNTTTIYLPRRSHTALSYYIFSVFLYSRIEHYIFIAIQTKAQVPSPRPLSQTPLKSCVILPSYNGSCYSQH